MTSDGAELILTGDIAGLSLCKNLLTGSSVLILLVFTISLFVHKMIGVELLCPIQTIYFVHLINNYYSQPYSLLRYLVLSSWNLTSIDNVSANVYSIRQDKIFSCSSQSFTLGLMFVCVFSSILCYSLVFLFTICKYSERNPLPKFINKVLLFIYTRMLFPFAISSLLAFNLIANTRRLCDTC